MSSFQSSVSTATETVPATTIVTTSWNRRAAAWPNRKVSSPAWAAFGILWIKVSSTRPKPKKTASVMPRALSKGTRLRAVTVRTASVASQPASAAPAMMTTGILLPVSRNASAIPGRAAWLTASPSRLWRRSTANEPRAPEVAPSTPEPRATMRSV